MVDRPDRKEVLRVARSVLAGAKSSIEHPFVAQYRQKTAYIQTYKNVLLAIESIRITLVAAGRNNLDGDHPLRLAHEIYQLRNNAEYAEILRALKFRIMPGDPYTKRQDKYYERFAGDIRVSEALNILEALLLESEDPSAFPSGTVTTLRRIVPDQKIAPLQFVVVDGILSVHRRGSSAREADAKSIETAKSQLQRNGDVIISELERSNCDKRLLASLNELQAQFDGEIDAIRVGLMNIGCETMCNAFDAELPLALASMLHAHTRGVQMFVGQYPEWTTFVENAAAADLDKDDIEELKAASANVVRELKARPDLVSPEVPRTLGVLAELLDNPSQSGKRAAFAVLRSLENLVSRVFGYGANFLEKTAEKTIDKASTVASRVVVGMLLLGIASAVAIGPIAGKVPDMNWMKTAAEIVRKQLSELKD